MVAFDLLQAIHQVFFAKDHHVVQGLSRLPDKPLCISVTFRSTDRRLDNVQLGFNNRIEGVKASIPIMNQIPTFL
jgi:hypothetical protein